MHNDSTDNFMTPPQLAEFLAVSLATIYRYIDKRVIPFYKVGGLLRFKKTEIEQYLSSVRVEPIVK